MQEALNIKDHNGLFELERYKESQEAKKAFEKWPTEDEIEKVRAYTCSDEYKEKNFGRTALTINPAKACQPLGAIFAAAGFDGCLPYVHGSQGCTAYFRSHFNRHFKEPFAAVSDSMTEDAAVFGGHKNMIAGLKNAYALYKPKMIAVSSTCMAEVIGDDLNAFIKNAKKAESVPADFPVPFAHTPSFVGSHVTGYDNMLKGILFQLTQGVEKAPADNGKVNIIPGFDGFAVGNIQEIKRILKLMGVDSIVLADNSDVLDTPLDGTYKMYAGGTTIEEVKAAKNARATFALLPDSVEKATKTLIKDEWAQQFFASIPLGLAGTDAWLMKLSEVTGKEIPAELERERGKALDAMTDSNYYLHGKRFAIFGDPSYAEALTDFYMELGAEPVHIVVTNGSKKWAKAFNKKLSESSFGKGGKVHQGADLWHLRSLMISEPVDFLVGSTHGKQIAKELDVPLIRIGFPIFDRHHLHRYPTFGYRGIINILTWTVNAILDDLDRKATFNNDFVR
ncbi:MAG: nitrogenase molybdenum-iron protein subunit beta [Deltaproteobacteria bacterium]|nr:nitrogenase molybdenum-iron protein subunit beta [Deltaproteobacteria bacterium]